MKINEKQLNKSHDIMTSVNIHNTTTTKTTLTEKTRGEETLVFGGDKKQEAHSQVNHLTHLKCVDS